jgi:hypothetical protein
MNFVVTLALVLGTLHAQNNLVSAEQRYFTAVRHSLETSADVMPPEKFGYRITDAQMTFAEWLIHSAQRNYADCATLKAEAAPESTKQLASLKSKDEVSKALKDSFAYCAAALDKMDDQKVLATSQMSTAFLHIVVHNNEIYGNLVGYLRSSGIVPPSTAGRGGASAK